MVRQYQNYKKTVTESQSFDFLRQPRSCIANRLHPFLLENARLKLNASANDKGDNDNLNPFAHVKVRRIVPSLLLGIYSLERSKNRPTKAFSRHLDVPFPTHDNRVQGQPF